MKLTSEYRAEFCARLRHDFPEAYPMPYDVDRDPACFILPLALPSRALAMADRLVARAREAQG